MGVEQEYMLYRLVTVRSGLPYDIRDEVCGAACHEV